MKKQSLAGIWTLNGTKVCDDNQTEKIICNVDLPGDFHSALLKNQIIPDPFYGFNEQDVLWVGRSDWCIERDFDFEKSNDIKQRTFIEITEADTVFTLFINGSNVGQGKNQFARYRFDVTDYLYTGINHISILFESAEKISARINETLPYSIPYMKYDVYSPNRNLLRKCQCHGGWDWGPCLMVSGIYGEISLITVTDGLFNNVKVTYENDEDNWNALITAEFQGLCNKSKSFNFSIEGPDIEKVASKVNFDIVEGKNILKTKLTVKNPTIWKTSGELKELNLTENVIYKLSVSEKDTENGIISINKNICFSTLKIVSYKDKDEGKDGRCLYFENNGRKIFAKGSNWIPADSLPSRLTDQRYFNLIKSAVDANHNCIRVWGGGFYEKEIFYDLCDRFGLIVWQDCMFACAMYPVTEDFIKQVELELEYQIPRLQSHPCIGLWCGNNENYGALQWFPESRNNREQYLIDYDRLYNGIIGKKIKKLDNSRIYWPSSPSSGPDSYGDNWHSDNSGDMHYWSVWHEKKSFDAYLSIRPRFVSEFGYESFPSLDTIKSFAEEKDFNFTSPLMEYHQRSPSGNSIILENFSRYFQFPVGFENMIYLSQVQQAIAIKTAVDWWRSLNPHCMGALVWQLNDIWPGPSWSSLEYNGKWKLLHYEQKKFFQNVYMPVFIKDNLLHTVICNDTNKSIKGYVTYRYISFDGNEYKPTLKKAFTVPADTTFEVFCESWDLAKSKDYFVYAEMEATLEEWVGTSIKPIKRLVQDEVHHYKCENTVFFEKYKKCNLEKANISCEIEKLNANDLFEITLTCEKPAFFVALDTIDFPGQFSNNLLTVLPQNPLKVQFKANSKCTLRDFKKALIIKDLRSTY
ncbi:MAG: glycoside hydrolase family 2 protein [Treponema sp.]|nr:glycoside hydrolase family 2 protein [Treponema sp.]